MIEIEYITAASLAANAVLIWIWARRRELMDAVLEVRRALHDNTISDEEYQNILGKLELVIDKTEV